MGSVYPMFPFSSGQGRRVPGDLEIAVIDDDESFRVALVESLSSFGYGVEGYASAEEYILCAGARAVDCVVAVIHTPGMSGLDWVEHLGAKGLATPVILISARSDKNLEARAAAARAVGLL